MDVRKVIFWMVHTTMHKVEVWELCGVTSTFSPDTENNKSDSSLKLSHIILQKFWKVRFGSTTYLK